MRRTPLHLAVGAGLSLARDEQRQPVVAMLLDDPDVEVNAQDSLGAIFAAVDCCMLDDLDVEVNAQDSLGALSTAVTCCCRSLPLSVVA